MASFCNRVLPFLAPMQISTLADTAKNDNKLAWSVQLFFIKVVSELRAVQDLFSFAGTRKQTQFLQDLWLNARVTFFDFGTSDLPVQTRTDGWLDFTRAMRVVWFLQLGPVMPLQLVVAAGAMMHFSAGWWLCFFVVAAKAAEKVMANRTIERILFILMQLSPESDKN